MKKISFVCVLLYACSASAVQVSLSANEVFQGDSLSLHITDSNPIGQVDLAPLSKDFMLGGQQRGQSSRFVNGVGSTTYELGVVLFPTKTGEIQIPALNVSGEMTTPLTLTVKASGEAKADATPIPTIQLQANVSNNAPYVGQSLFYTLQLTDGMGIVAGEVLPSQNDKIRIVPVGQDSEKTSLQDGKRVRVIERTYRMVPQESGNLKIDPAFFNGEIAYQHTRKKTRQPLFGFFDGTDFFQDFMATTRPVQIMSNSIQLNVQPQPQDWVGWWLPSTDVQLNVSYQQPDDLKVGDAIQGELTLTAMDVDGNDLPVVKVPTKPDFRIYPEPEERTTQTTPDGHVKGIVKTKFSLVPLKEGIWEIPEIQVPWFNTKTAQKEMAKIEAYPLNVAPGEVAAPVLEPAIPVQQIPQKGPQSAQDHFKWGILLGVGIAILFFGLIGGIWWFVLRWKTHPKKEKKKPIPDFYLFK